jgi:RNA polymerase sigma-70 factor (ECF subfamily)
MLNVGAVDNAFPMPSPAAAFIPAPIPDGKVDERDEPLAEDHTAEADLVAAAQGGDRDAFARLYVLHRPAIFRMARFHVGGAAEDAVSEVFVRAWKSLGRYVDTGRPFVAWLYGIARHVLVDELRSRRARPVATVPDGPDRSPDPDDRLQVAAALRRVPDDQRRVIEMKFFLGMANPEVAAALGKSVGAVNALQWRALQALRDLMEPS